MPHAVRTAAPEVAALLDAGAHDAVLVDARQPRRRAQSAPAPGQHPDSSGDGGALVLGELVIDEATCSARLPALTYKEFEPLEYLAQHAGRVFVRAQLLQEVWGYDFSEVPAPSTCTSGGCGRSWAPSTSR